MDDAKDLAELERLAELGGGIEDVFRGEDAIRDPEEAGRRIAGLIEEDLTERLALADCLSSDRCETGLLGP